METQEKREVKTVICAEDIKRMMPGKLLLHRLPTEVTTVHGVALPDNKTEKNLWCRVIKAGGPTIKYGSKVPCVISHIPVEPGTLVSVRQYTGQKISKVDSNLIIIDGTDVEGIMSDDMFVPCWNRVLVKADERQEKMGRFYLPEISRGEPASGTVIGAGPGYFSAKGGFIDTAAELPPGTRVHFNRWAGYRVTVKGQEYSLVQYFADFEWREHSGGKEGAQCTRQLMSSCKSDVWLILPPGMVVDSVPVRR